MGGDVTFPIVFSIDATTINGLPYEQFRGIALGEGALLDAGFIKRSKGYKKGSERIRVIETIPGKPRYFYYSAKNAKNIEIFFLHQLQNLHYSIYNTEL